LKLVVVNVYVLLALTELMKKKLIELIGKKRREIFVMPARAEDIWKYKDGNSSWRRDA
jgi:hypothetical protein